MALSKRDQKPSKAGRSRTGSAKFGIAADDAAFIDPFKDWVLAAYLASVRDWHGYIRFLGLPHLRENPDIVIDRLYVEPLVADRYVSPDLPLEDWPATEAIRDTASEHRRLVLLGDPGSGKSTLVNWLAWQFAQPAENEWTRSLGRLVPIPIILRDMVISKGITWPGLLQAFLNHEMCEVLRGQPHLQDLLHRGQALIMLDGLDEIGDIGVRTELCRAVFDGMGRYPACRWLLTSRIVGYEAIPSDLSPEAPRSLISEEGAELPIRRGKGGKVPDTASESGPIIALRYVVPFTDDQIARFARNWFAQREAVGKLAERGARDLLAAIKADKATHRLARVPNLLTMMALIHRVRARLPHGRALLYNEITQAYLQSIDEYRGLLEVDYPLAQKRRWLARVGFEMRRRRSVQVDGEHPVSREVLVNEADVKAWIAEAMGESGYGRDEQVSATFIDYIGRRSGLLLPRGPGQFTFMHLSFQEYFAACFLAEQATSPQWIRRGKAAPGADRESLRVYTREVFWRETLVFLFELLADQTGWPETLAEDLFGPDFQDLQPGSREDLPAGVLLARLAVNPHSGFTHQMRKLAIQRCCQLEIAIQQTLQSDTETISYKPEVFRILFSTEPDQVSGILHTLVAVAQEVKATTLVLSQCTAVDSNSVRSLVNLNLQLLDLSSTGVTDITPLRGLTNLQSFNLRGTEVKDIAPLRGLTNLQTLDLSGTEVTDIEPLRDLTNLHWLDLSGTRMTDEQVKLIKAALPRVEVLN